MHPSRNDELVRRRIDVDGGRDPTDGTILSPASLWHSNVASGKARGFPRPSGTSATTPSEFFLGDKLFCDGFNLDHGDDSTARLTYGRVNNCCVNF